MMGNLFRQMPPHARLWIFQSSKPFAQPWLAELEAELNRFVGKWKAHGQELLADYALAHGRFLLVAVDEAKAAASGCSIDALLRIVAELDQRFELDWLNRMKVAYRGSDKDVKEVSMARFTELLTTGECTAQTLVFNNLVATVGELATDWEVPVLTSWHARLLP